MTGSPLRRLSTVPRAPRSPRRLARHAACSVPGISKSLLTGFDLVDSLASRSLWFPLYLSNAPPAPPAVCMHVDIQLALSRRNEMKSLGGRTY